MKTMNTIINSIMQMKKYICAVVLLTGLSTYAWGTVDEISGFGDCPWDFCTDCSDYSSGTFTSGTYTFVGTDVKDDSFYEELLLKKKTGALTLPVYNTAVTQIKLYAGAGSSMNDMTISIYVDGTLQTTTTMNNGNTDYGCGYTSRTLSVNYPAGSTITLKNEDKNEVVHLAKIEITHSGSTSGSGIPINKQYYNEGGSFTCTVGGNEVAKVTTGQTVTLTANPNPGYSLYGYTVTAVSRTCNKSYNPPITDYEEDISVTNNTFVVPNVSYYDYIIVEAMWDDCTPNDITINVASGSGSADVASNACEGETVTFTASPATGYQYAGAVVSGDNTYINLSSSQYSFTMPNEDVDIDVNFSAKTYTINLNGNSGTGHTPSVTATYGSHTLSSAITNPSRTGYTFGGWYSGSGGTGTMIINTSGTLQANTSFTDASGNWTHDGGTTLYAKWTANTISLTLDKNNSDASGSTSGSASVKYDATALESGTVHATRTGYVLEGYYAEPACTHKVLTNTGALVNYTGYVVSGKWARTTTPTTLYAKWTQLYTLAVANNANVADMTATPSGASAITEGNSSNVAGGTSVTLAHGAVTSPYTWAGWHVTKTSDGTDVTGTCVAGNTLTMPEYNVTVDAYVFADFVAFCEAEPEVTISGTIKVTSTNGKWVKAADVLQVSGTNLSTATITVASSSADVRLSKTGAKSSFAQSITINVISNTVETTNIYVAYNPSETTDGINNTVVVTVKDNPSTPTAQASTTAGDIQCRHLPAKFVIATMIGGNWYALPNNVTTASYGTRDLSYPLIVDDANDPTTATIYTSTTDYLAWGLNVAGPTTDRFTTDGDKIAFVSAIGNKGLAGNNSGLRNSAALPATTSDDYPGFTWTPSTTDLANYTLQNGSATSYYVATNGSDKWTTATTGANVRFLTYDAHEAPTITWQNDMLGSQHAQNTAENGVVTLPTGGDPVSCNATLLPTFCGWKDGAIATYVTSAPTYVQAGDAATTAKTYYAVFKHATLDRWYTSCPTIYTITYKANGGTGADHVEYTMNSTADAITVGAAGFSKEGSTFVGWTNPSDESGAIITPGAGKITGLSGDITLNAVWIGTTNVTGTVRLTASAGEKVATGATEITISSTDFACATALRITYYDVTNDVTYGRTGSPTYTSSEFRLCNGSYGSADGTNISLAEVSGAYNQTFSITYEPNGGANTLDHYELVVEVLLKNTVIETKRLNLYGRTLPTVFAIATKIGGAWYALPNDMSASGTYDPILISVTEDASVLNWTAQGPSNTAYIMRDYTANYSKLRFAINAAEDANKYCLWAADGDAAGIRNYSATSTEANYGWIVSETNADFSGYTMATSNNTRTGLMISGDKWEMANSGYSEIHFIPLTTVEMIDIIPREWKTNGLVFAIDADDNVSLTSGHTKYGIDAAPSINVTSITRHSTGGYGLYEVGLPDLTSHYGKVLTLKMKIGGVDKNANVTIPIIVSGTTTTTTAETPFTALGTASKDYDVVILDGAKLTTNATASGAHAFHNFYVYSGGTWINDNGSTSLYYLELRGGIKGIDAKNTHVQGVPHVMLKKTVSSTTGANLDMTVYTDHGYALSVPFDVALSKVNFANSLKPGTGAQVNGTLASQFFIRKYDGEVRANNGKGGWVDITPSDNKTIHAGEGYTLQGKRPKGQPFAVIRFPFTGVSSWANSSGEVEKGAIPIYAYAGSGTTPDNDKGWNLIANPYMATIAYNTDDELTWAAAFKVGSLVQTEGDTWDGKYEWKNASHAYVTIPNDSYTEYPQTRASKATFYPFKNFFIQTDANGAVTFVRTDRQEMPRYLMPQEEQSTPIYADINLAHGEESAQAGLTIDEEATAGYKFGEDYSIFESREALDYLKVYTIADGHYLVGNTLTPEETAELIPLEFYAPSKEGEYIFSLDDESDSERLEYVILYDAELGISTNLLQKDYHFTVEESGIIENRFSINLTLKKENDTTTGAGTVKDTENRPTKFIYQDKMYILYKGVIYDAVGKKIREIK